MAERGTKRRGRPDTVLVQTGYTVLIVITVRPMPQRRPTSLRGLVARIADELLAQIQSGALPAGARLPSVRQLAHERRISPFSAAEIYNALVAAAVVEARAGSGYFVPPHLRASTEGMAAAEFPTDSVWERRREASARRIEVDAGFGWRPSGWLHEAGVRAALRPGARPPPPRPHGSRHTLGPAE